ncbi:MAG TPA: PfkB family carbohydrate kinase, partial [Bacteroidota bacterium]
FEIVAPAAWDMIRMTPDLAVIASSAPALVFGSLAQRAEPSAATIRELLAISRLNVFDVNLRPPFDSKAVVQESLARSQIVKLNDQELLRLAGWFGLPRELEAAAAALAERFGPRMVCVTLGPNGAALWNDGCWTRHPGFRVQVRDSVGAGDAFLASLLKGYLEGWGDAQILQSANAHGAYVASKDGATPRLDREELHAIEASAQG